MRTDAAGLRKELGAEFRESGIELGLARDRALRAKMTADHAVEDADQRTTSMEASLAETRQALAKGETALAAANAKGNTSAAAEQQEFNDGFRDMIAQAQARLHANKLDSAATREAAGTAERAARETQLAYEESTAAITAAETEIDKIENQAALIEQARMKLVETDLKYGGDPPADADIDRWVTARATLEGAAENLLKQADAITVDRRIIAVVVPTADDPVAPKPLSDDLMDPNDDATEVPAPTDDADPLPDDVAGEGDDDRPNEVAATEVDAISGADALGLDPLLLDAPVVDTEYGSDPTDPALAPAADADAAADAVTEVEHSGDVFAAVAVPDATDAEPIEWATADAELPDTNGWETTAADDEAERLDTTGDFSDTDGF